MMYLVTYEFGEYADRCNGPVTLCLTRDQAESVVEHLKRETKLYRDHSATPMPLPSDYCGQSSKLHNEAKARLSALGIFEGVLGESFDIEEVPVFGVDPTLTPAESQS